MQVTLQADQRPKQNPQKRNSASSSTRTIPIGERTWTDVEPGKHSLSDYPVSKRLIHLLRHGRLPRDNDGAIEFWRIKDHLQKHFLHCRHWSDDKWKNKAWKKHQNTVCWVDINLALKKGGKFHQTRSNAIIIHETLTAYCIPKVVRMETREVIYEKIYMSPRPPPKISLKHDWKRELGSEDARQPEGEVVRQAKNSQPSQPNPNPDHDRTGRPVVCRDANHERSTVVCSEQASHPRFSREGQNPILEEDVNHDRTGRPVVCPQGGAPQTRFSCESTNFILEEETTHDRTVKPVVCRDANHERSMLNEVDIDFRISGLPHSVVKQADNYRVRDLVKKIENHPHRQSLQQDPQQDNA